MLKKLNRNIIRFLARLKPMIVRSLKLIIKHFVILILELNEDLENLMGKIKTTANKVRRKLKQIQGQIEEEAASANQSADFRIKKTQVRI